ncbi:hypothetical protein EU537_05110 [Candidatus Thorarchaeota archaeon]|nr:MAG: hypothetical protein EU537_05110 [Candidatus Thorarchaeota archaeon]
MTREITKNYLVIGIFLVVILHSYAFPVVALRHWWGIEEGDEYEFELYVESSGHIKIDYRVMLRVINTPNLTDTFSSISRIPLVEVEQSFLNGTELILDEPWNKALEHLAYPVGDWWLLSTYIEQEDMVDYELIEDSDFWGYEWRNILRISLTNIEASLRAVYLKDDGFLSHYVYKLFDTGTNETLEYREASRMNIQLGIERVLTILAPPLTIAVVALVVLLAAKRYRPR